MIGGMLAKLCDAGVGRTLRVESGGRVKELTVAAVVMDYHYGGLSLYVDREFARRHLGVDGVNAFLVSLEPGATQRRGRRPCVPSANGFA